MVRRLIVGLVLGVVVGVGLAAALAAGLKVEALTGAGGIALGYAAAAVAGVLLGFVAGKPIWAHGAKVEAGLKAFFGAVLAAGGLFALRQWAGGFVLDLRSFGAGGPAPIGSLPAAALPLISVLLGVFFELDNTGDDAAPAERKRVAPQAGKPATNSRVPESEAVDGAEDPGLSLRSKR